MVPYMALIAEFKHNVLSIGYLFVTLKLQVKRTSLTY